MHTHDGFGSSTRESSTHEAAPHAIVLFDGVCNVCNDSVKFILARDPAGYFRFASLQSDVAKRLLRPFGLAEMPLHTMALIEGERVYLKSSAVLRVARRHGAGWPLLSFALRLVPRPVRDVVYSF